MTQLRFPDEHSLANQYWLKLLPLELRFSKPETVHPKVQKPRMYNYKLTVHRGFQKFDETKNPISVIAGLAEPLLKFGMPHIVSFYLTNFNPNIQVTFTLRLYGDPHKEKDYQQVGKYEIDFNFFVSSYHQQHKKVYHQVAKLSDQYQLVFELYIDHTLIQLNKLIAHIHPLLNVHNQSKAIDWKKDLKVYSKTDQKNNRDFQKTLFSKQGFRQKVPTGYLTLRTLTQTKKQLPKSMQNSVLGLQGYARYSSNTQNSQEMLEPFMGGMQIEINDKHQRQKYSIHHQLHNPIYAKSMQRILSHSQNSIVEVPTSQKPNAFIREPTSDQNICQRLVFSVQESIIKKQSEFGGALCHSTEQVEITKSHSSEFREADEVIFNIPILQIENRAQSLQQGSIFQEQKCQDEKKITFNKIEAGMQSPLKKKIRNPNLTKYFQGISQSVSNQQSQFREKLFKILHKNSIKQHEEKSLQEIVESQTMGYKKSDREQDQKQETTTRKTVTDDEIQMYLSGELDSPIKVPGKYQRSPSSMQREQENIDPQRPLKLKRTQSLTIVNQEQQTLIKKPKYKQYALFFLLLLVFFITVSYFYSKNFTSRITKLVKKRTVKKVENQL